MTIRALLFVSIFVIGAIAGYRPTAAPASSFVAQVVVKDTIGGGYNYDLEVRQCVRCAPETE